MAGSNVAWRVAAVAAFTASTVLSDAAARVESFSPTGFTKDVRQVVVRFSEPMVALGDPERESPFTIDCAVPGAGRWIDERHWVYDFDYDVPGAVRCRFTLREDVRTYAGEEVEARPREGVPEYAFDTGGPAILDHEPKWRRTETDERQVFLLALDAVADADSIRRHARCRVVGERSRAVELLDVPDRTEVLDALSEHEPRLLRGLVLSASSHLPSGNEEATRIRALERIVAVRCRGPLPNYSDVELIWGAGVAGANGLASPRDDTLTFSVRPEFRATLRCSKTYEDFCLGGVHIAFSALVGRGLAGRIRLLDADGNVLAGEMEDQSQIDRVDFPGARRQDAVYRAELVEPFADIDGRRLANAGSFPQTVRIVHPPSASFSSQLLVVESGQDTPVLLRSVSGPLAGRRLRVTRDVGIVRWLRRFQDAQRDRDGRLPGSPWKESFVGGQGRRFTMPTPETEASPRVAGVATPRSGLHVLELELPAAEGLPLRYAAGLAMPTDLGVHFHHGDESSLVWVTRLSDAVPVADAEVRILDGCTGRSLAHETTDADGLARFSRSLPTIGCGRDIRYFAIVRKNGDVAVVGSGPWWSSGRTVASVILDRTLYRPGETVSVKLVVRRPTSRGLVIPALPATAQVTVTHYPTEEEHRLTIDLAGNGSGVGELQLPESAPLGFYSISAKFERDHHWLGEFRVERFKVGAMRATVTGPEQPLVNPRSVPVDLSVEHLAGGGAAALPVSLRTVLSRVGYWEDRANPRETHTQSLILDGAGRASVDVPVPKIDGDSYLEVELDYWDANGERRTATNGFGLWPAAVALGIGDLRGTDRLKSVRIFARRPDGGPAAGVPVEVSILPARTREKWRLPGGFRTTRSVAGSAVLATCSGTTDASGAMTCDVPAELTSVLVKASALDRRGNRAHASRSLSYWTKDAEPPLLQVEDGPKFAVGDTVPVRVNLPFAQASVLVNIEREGVLDAFVERLAGPDAVVKVPVRRSYVPNVDISVMAVRARTASQVSGGVDLAGNGRSDAWDYRHETVQVAVGLDTHTLAVRVETDREAYRVRERAKVRIAVEDPDGLPRPDADVALVAVDEALLDLWPNSTWELLHAMMGHRSATVRTTTNLDQLETMPFELDDVEEVRVTSYHLSSLRSSRMAFDRSGPPAPDAIGPRRDFDSLLLWRGRVSLGTDGTAEIDIPLNDLLTSFRIVAVAAAGEDLFGTGEKTIRTSQDLIVHAGLPEVVREGDRFDAVFTVRNASDRTRRVTVAAEANGFGELPGKALTLLPGRSREVSWPVTVPVGAEDMAWNVTAASKSANDALAARQTVEPVVPVRVQQATLTHLSESREFPVAPPADALPGRGGVRVSLKPSLLGGLDAVREDMARYPYTCIEQKVSVAIVLGDEQRWRDAMDSARAAIDPDGLVRFFPSQRLVGSPTLTAYVLTIADAAGKVIPEGLREEMIDGLLNYLDGRVVRRSAFRAVDRKLRRLTALAALARHGAATAHDARDLDPNVELLPTSGLLDWIDVLIEVDPDGDELREAREVLRARLNLQGTTMGLSTEKRDWLWWLMVSPDGNAARAVLSILDDADWRVDAPRMIRGLFGRQQRGSWHTTVANAWGTVAAQRFAGVFEADPVTGTSLVGVGDAQRRVEWPHSKADAAPPAPVDVPWSSAEKLTLDHQGTGTPWGLVQLRAAVPRTEAVRAGYRIERQVEPVLRESPDVWQRGDVARVELTITADADMTWVVVEDPIPPGATILGSGLGGDSYLLSEGNLGDRWPVFTEREFDSYRAYFHYVPKGTFTVGYSVRYNTSGDFHLPPARVEAMYMPEMFAEEPVADVSIR